MTNSQVKVYFYSTQSWTNHMFVMTVQKRVDWWKVVLKDNFQGETHTEEHQTNFKKVLQHDSIEGQETRLAHARVLFGLWF